MEAKLKLKLLQYLLQKEKHKGFTLIELLIVVIITGLLSAIAIYGSVNAIGKARETEAKNGIATLNRVQQSYHFERQRFALPLTDSQLENNNLLGVTISSNYYDFSTTNGNEKFVVTIANAVDPVFDRVRSYVGAVQFRRGLYKRIICQTRLIENLEGVPIPDSNEDNNVPRPRCPFGTGGLDARTGEFEE